MPASDMRVLVTAAGAGPGVAIIKAIRAMGGFVLGVDMSRESAGMHLASEGALVPRADDPSYADRLLSLCAEHRLGMVIPILDVEAGPVSAASARFADAGVYAAVNGPWCVQHANDKKLSFEVCAEAGVPQPARFDDPRSAPADAFPLIGKPIRGVGSHGIVVAQDVSKLPADTSAHLWQRFIEGPEFSIDTFGDPASENFVAVPRHRREVRSGQMVRGETVHDPALQDFARRTCAAFRVTDVSCLQVIRDDQGALHFVELNPRYGTGISLSIAAGVPFPYLQWLAYHDPSALEPSMLAFRPLTMVRYWEEVFL